MHNLIHRALAAEKKLFILLVAVMGFASCNTNEPVTGDGPEPNGVSFQLIVKNRIPPEADVLVVPPTPEAEYLWLYAQESFIAAHYQSLQAYAQNALSHSSYDALKTSKRIISGKQLLHMTDLKEDTEYRVVVCQVDPELHIIGDVASVKFLCSDKPEPFQCQIRITERTDTSVVIDCVPSYPEVNYFWACFEEKDIKTSDLKAYMKSYMSQRTISAWQSLGQICRGTQQFSLTYLRPATAYRFMLCTVDMEPKPTSDVIVTSFTTLELEDPDPQDRVVGLFSVAPNLQVVFSPGNLQYQPSTNTWQFAPHQWDCIAKDNNQIGVATYDGWIDLFGWGTGNAPTKCTKEQTDYTVYSEWGHHMASENAPWRTLTADEWTYLFTSRTNAEKRFAFGTVNSTKGLIILPDNWTQPDDVIFNPSLEKGLVQTSSTLYKNTTNDNYSHNSYNAQQWNKMEKAGAIFLPFTGGRYGTEMFKYGVYGSARIWNGYYWSATSPSTGHAYHVRFEAKIFSPNELEMSFYGYAVRLVRNVK